MADGLKNKNIYMNLYENPNPIAIIIMVKIKNGEIKLLVVERGIASNIGRICFPSRYIDKMKTAQKAACREFYEETVSL